MKSTDELNHAAGAVNERVESSRWTEAQRWEHDFWIRQQKNLVKFGRHYICRLLTMVGAVAKYRGDGDNHWLGERASAPLSRPEGLTARHAPCPSDSDPITECKLLVALTSYGTLNDRHLSRLIQEYQSMSFDVDILVLSNIRKNLGHSIEGVVRPYGNPRTLAFLHKQVFADRLEAYDLFLYSEDDVLVTERNIHAYLSASQSLGDGEIAGFLRFEKGANDRNYPDIHGNFHWDPSSVRRRGDSTWAHLTNEHSACYLLTRAQLRRAIDSGGYLVRPHQGKYDLLCAAATDPYTQCGFRKLLCVSEIDKFLVHHLSNKYVGTCTGIGEREFRTQIEGLLAINAWNEVASHPSVLAEARLAGRRRDEQLKETDPGRIRAQFVPGV
jgi:hypothetical protein